MARPASPSRPWSRRSPSAACSPRSSSSTGRRSTCSRRWGWPSCSPCWPPMRLSRTLTPITIGLLLKGEQPCAADEPRSAGCSARLHHAFERGFESMRQRYVELLDGPARRIGSSCPSSPSLIVALRRGAVHLGRPRLLPGDRRRSDPAPRARAGRHAHRGDRTTVPGGRGQDPRGHSRAATAS